jgi:sec-independent protein translocase protein TatB
VFDVAFSELVVITIVALIVIGPEKLPKVARTLGALAGRLQRYVANVKSDIEREMQFEDLQKLQQEIKQGVDQAQASAKELENSIGGTLTQIKKPETPSGSSQ